jgi:hypothetical protein
MDSDSRFELGVIIACLAIIVLAVAAIEIADWL